MSQCATADTLGSMFVAPRRPVGGHGYAATSRLRSRPCHDRGSSPASVRLAPLGRMTQPAARAYLGQGRLRRDTDAFTLSPRKSIPCPGCGKVEAVVVRVVGESLPLTGWKEARRVAAALGPPDFAQCDCGGRLASTACEIAGRPPPRGVGRRRQQELRGSCRYTPPTLRSGRSLRNSEISLPHR